MQIQNKITVPISECYRAKKEGTWKEPSYKECCPLCAGKNCAVKHGKYERQTFDENGNLIKDFPIQRWKCMKKSKVTRTFSVLPDKLMPYHKHPLNMAVKIMNQWKNLDKNIGESLDSVFMNLREAGNELLETSESQAYRFLKIFENARQKYIVWNKTSRTFSLESFIGLCRRTNYLNAETLNLNYYSANGGYISNSQFLFGTAS